MAVGRPAKPNLTAISVLGTAHLFRPVEGPRSAVNTVAVCNRLGRRQAFPFKIELIPKSNLVGQILPNRSDNAQSRTKSFCANSPKRVRYTFACLWRIVNSRRYVPVIAFLRIVGELVTWGHARTLCTSSHLFTNGGEALSAACVFAVAAESLLAVRHSIAGHEPLSSAIALRLSHDRAALAKRGDITAFNHRG